MSFNDKPYIIGIDMGGTHCDGVLLNTQSFTVEDQYKLPILQSSPLQAIMQTLLKLLKSEHQNKIQRIVLSTTLVTNALSYQNTPKIGALLICTVGVDPNELEMTTPYYALKKGYVNHMGQVVSPLDTHELEESVKYFKDQGIDTVVVVQKFSNRNPILEKQALSYLQSKGLRVFGSSFLSGNLNFPRRCYSGIFNAQAYDIFFESLKDLETQIELLGFNAPLFLLKTDGGHFSLNQALEFPIETILSGPSASLVGAFNLLSQKPSMNDSCVLTIDIGGTTSDLGIIHNHEIVIKNQVSLLSKNTLIDGIVSYPIALGGDTKVNMINNDLSFSKREDVPLLFGGKHPTLTDFLECFEYDNKDLYQKLLDYYDLSKDQLNTLYQKVKEHIVSDFTYHIKNFLKEANTYPVYKIKDFYESQQSVISPTTIALMGAASYYFKPLLEKHFKAYKVVLLPYFDVLNAMGSALSMPSLSLSLFYSPLTQVLHCPQIDYSSKVGSFNLDQAEQWLKNQFRSVYKDLYKIDLHDDDLLIYEKECFALIKGYNKIGDHIRLKMKRKVNTITPLNH